MNNYLYRISTLLVTILAVIILQGKIVQAQSLSPKEINSIAKSITVLIENPGDIGSGVIVNHHGDTYTVLTAEHVLEDVSIKSNLITNDNKQYPLNRYRICKFDDKIDLAIVKFTSSKEYPIAKIGDSSKVAIGSKVYVAGFPVSSGITRSSYQFVDGKITGTETDHTYKEGYGLVYDNKTLPGMSGGPVFNEAGELIGIHGKGDINTKLLKTKDPNLVIKTGFNLAVPINIYSKALPDIQDCSEIIHNPQVFYKLDEYLDAKNFWDADLETKKLLFEYFHINVSGYLTEESIKKLPCELLSTIDKKWSYASAGQFGFSIQKSLMPKKAQDKEEDKERKNRYDEFASLVGWTFRGEYVEPNKDKYNLNAPKGHLPRQFLDGPIWTIFIDKINECNL